MSRYDWDWNRGDDPRFGGRGRRAGYGADFGSWGDAWGSAPDAGFWGRGVGLNRSWGTPWEARGYDRERYGPSYPGYGGYPGGRERGMYYGGRGGGYGMEYRGRAAGERGWGGGRGYDRGFARERFLPEDAYRRHPELNRPQRHLSDRWPDSGHELERDLERSDEEILQAVKQSLYQDDYLAADRIEVEVNDQVVTLRGEVDDYLEARYAWDDAWEASGVRGVINQLTVRTDRLGDGHEDPLPQTAGGKAKAPAGKAKK